MKPSPAQTELRFARDKNGQHRGGKRAGAGRPKSKRRVSEPHRERPLLSGREPVLVTARVSKRTANLRRRDVYNAVRHALKTVLAHAEFRVVHFSIQRNHLHLIVEAADRQALSRGMQGFLIAAAKRINRAFSADRRGTVFPDRYHQRVLGSPRQCWNAIRYVLNNFRRHGEDRRGAARTWLVDPWSSAVTFGGWRDLDTTALDTPAWYEPPPTSRPETWLLERGWQRHGLIGLHDVPGPQHEL